MNREKIMKMAGSVRTAGKGTVRRNRPLQTTRSFRVR
ncbi:hypothetical protein LINPERHAP1_LOCUS25139 [Linum perenne]